MLSNFVKVVSTNIKNKIKTEFKVESKEKENGIDDKIKCFQLNETNDEILTDSIYTKKQRIALKNFRAKITDVELDWFDGHNTTLMRWLESCDMNVDKAYRLYQKNQRWKKANNMDNILQQELPEFLLNDFPFKVSGFDNDGDLVVIIPFSNWNFKNIVEKGLKESLIRYLHYVVSVTYQFARVRCTRNEIHSKISMILDLKGFDLNMLLHLPTVEFLLQILKTLADNHPQTFKVVYFVNCEGSCEYVWKLARPLLTFRTFSKVYIFDCNEKIWQKKLLENIQPPNLPVEYGGSYCSVPDFSQYFPLIAFVLVVQSKLDLIISESVGHLSNQCSSNIDFKLKNKDGQIIAPFF